MEIVHDHPDLAGLELFETGEITDLTPLKDLRHLKYLLVETPNADPDPLLEMKGLRWLAVSQEKKEADEEPQGEDRFVKLQKALPQTAIVGVVPLCLGSGWILLLVPATGLAWLIEKWRNPDAFAAGTKDARV